MASAPALPTGSTGPTVPAMLFHSVTTCEASIATRRAGRPGAVGAIALAALLAGSPAGADAPAGPPAAAASPCPGPALRIEPLAAGVWWIPGAAGDADEVNRGRISNLLAVQDGERLWLLGSGPSAAFGRALGCRLQRLTGQAVTDVISPWARPELVLGQAGLGAPRHWAHVDVAEAMRSRCAQCIERLRQRLGRAADDLEDAAAPLPTQWLQGEAGRLGPWQWWRLQRAAQQTVTLWWLPRAGLAAAHGLLWADGPPDLRDSRIDTVAASLARADALAAQVATPGRLRWLPEQGDWLDAGAARRQHDYLQALRAAAQAAVERGDNAAEADPRLPGPAAALAVGERHGLNWQRAWREAEQRSFDNPER